MPSTYVASAIPNYPPQQFILPVSYRPPLTPKMGGGGGPSQIKTRGRGGIWEKEICSSLLFP